MKTAVQQIRSKSTDMQLKRNYIHLHNSQFERLTIFAVHFKNQDEHCKTLAPCDHNDGDLAIGRWQKVHILPKNGIVMQLIEIH